MIETTFKIDNVQIEFEGFEEPSMKMAEEALKYAEEHKENEKFVIIHGVGEGILKKTTHETLKKNKNVLEYAICYNNPGSTLVRLKFDK